MRLIVLWLTYFIRLSALSIYSGQTAKCTLRYWSYSGERIIALYAHSCRVLQVPFPVQIKPQVYCRARNTGSRTVNYFVQFTDRLVQVGREYNVILALGNRPKLLVRLLAFGIDSVSNASMKLDVFILIWSNVFLFA